MRSVVMDGYTPRDCRHMRTYGFIQVRKRSPEERKEKREDYVTRESKKSREREKERGKDSKEGKEEREK